MKKSRNIIFFPIIIIIGLYLYLTHTYIYRSLGWAGLKFFNWENEIVMSNNEISNKKMIYVSLGDSLTAGAGAEKHEDSFPYLLAEKFQNDGNNVILKNLSVPGYRTSDLVKKLLDKAIADQPDIVTLLIGTNDVHGSVLAGTFKKNYDFILNRLAKETKAKIYVISIPSIGAETLILPPWSYYLDWREKQFNKIIKELADNYKASYIDLYTPTLGILKRAGPHYSADLFHPSSAGYALWAKIIYDGINK